jgi:phosphate-selective porin OprO and OprP
VALGIRTAGRSASTVRWCACLALAAVAVCGRPSPTLAAPATAADIERLEKQIQQLQEEVDRLKQSDKAAGQVVEERVEQAEKASPVAGYKPGGFFIQNQKGDYVLRVGSYVQLDGRFFPGDPESINPDQFLVRRARLILEGSLGPYLDFKFQEDFSSQAKLFDAYADVKPFGDWVKVRLGKFKVPVGLERLQPATVLPLVERGAPTNLVPVRGLGAELWASYFGNSIGYELGVFDQAPDLSNVDGQLFDDFDFIGRVFSQPFATTDIAWIKGIGVGIAGSYGMEQGNVANPNLPVYRSFGQSSIFSYALGVDPERIALADGIASRWNPQASWYVGPLGVEAEYVSSRTPVRRGDTSDTLNNQAWAVTASYALTGEAEAWRGVVPTQPFAPFTERWTGQWGAVEIVGRVDALRIDPDAFRLAFADPEKSVRKDMGFGGGLNWIWSRNVKFALDYYHTRFKGGWNSGTYNRPTEDAVIGRFQFAL